MAFVRCLKWVLWPLSWVMALTAFWLAVTGKHDLKLLVLLAGGWVVASFGALILERVTRSLMLSVKTTTESVSR